MICENCGKREATSRYKSVYNGLITTKYLCEECAKAARIGSSFGGGISDILSSIFGDLTESKNRWEDFRCDNCKTSLSEIVQSGRVGCPACYKKFYNELLPYIKRLHGSVNYVGSIPNNAPLVIRQENRLAVLKETMQQLVAKEDFENAALVRDEIKKITDGGGLDE